MREVTRNQRLLFRDQDLFLAQKIEVGVTSGPCIDDGGKVVGKIVGVPLVIKGSLNAAWGVPMILPSFQG
jgi:hypothetical protein